MYMYGGTHNYDDEWSSWKPFKSDNTCCEGEEGLGGGEANTEDHYSQCESLYSFHRIFGALVIRRFKKKLLTR